MAAGKLDPALLSQIHLSGDVQCPLFTAHFLKPNICTACNKLINKHLLEAISDDHTLLKALEYSQKGEKVPTCILPSSEGMGGLFHGGFKGVMNADFLRKEKVTHILNTAKGLEIFGPKYLDAVKKARDELGVSFLELNWEDTTSFSIEEQDLVKSVEYVHRARMGGGGVLIHCAQGKSRSSTAVIAYLMACYNGKGVEFDEGLQIVQEQRKMAEPNPSFTKVLQTFGKSETLKNLREKLNH